MDATAGLLCDFVGGVLDEFKKLSITVSALSDSALTIGVFSHKPGVHRVSLEDTGGLLENGFNYRGGRGRHCFCAPDVSKCG
jgi:hypothetical protein